MTPYPEYKPTGLPWLPEIPREWEIKKLRHLLFAVSEKNYPEAQLLSVVREKGVVLRNKDDKEENHNYVPDDLSNYKFVRIGQFAMNKMKAWQGSYGISQFDGIVSPAYFVFKLQGVSSTFFHHAIRAKYYVPYFGQASDGIRVGQWDLSIPRMKEIPFCIPSPTEQAQIVRYLDAMTAKINKLIRAKKKEIALLQEQKQAIINRAVTKGLNPDVEMKDSGIDWLGKIPAHWKIVALKSVGAVRSGITLGKKYKRTDSLISMPYLRVANVQNGYVCLEDLYSIDVLPSEAQIYLLKKGDVLMTEGGDRDKLGRGCVWEAPIEKCIHQNHIFAVSVNLKWLNPYFLNYLTISDIGRSYFYLTATKTTNLACTNSSKVLAFTFPLPPHSEQVEILSYLDNKIKQYDNTMTKCKKEIEHFNEYKNSLISFVVTGQVDVRNIAVEDIPPDDLVPENNDPATDPEEKTTNAIESEE